jgi:D-alanyl-D-alanine dipeptidase
MDFPRRRRNGLLVTTMSRMSPIRLMKVVSLVLIMAGCNSNHETAMKITGDESQLLNLRHVDTTFVIDSRYASKNNFVGIQLYPENELFLLKPVAERLKRVQERLRAQNVRLKILDAYRPLQVQKKMWELVPDERYVANPAKGSNHNRGCAVDVTLVDGSGKDLAMPTPFDDFTERAHSQFMNLPEHILKNRQILRDAMTAEGFLPFLTEWWHFDDPDCRQWPVLDINPYQKPFFPEK